MCLIASSQDDKAQTGVIDVIINEKKTGFFIDNGEMEKLVCLTYPPGAK